MMNNIDESKARKYELASDLLNKMNAELNYASQKERNRIVLSRKHKFDALLLIDVMIRKGDIEGKTNTEVYDVYSYCSKSLGLKTMDKIELSKFLCRYFGFGTTPKRFGNKIERVYLKKELNNPEPEIKSKSYSVIGIEQWKDASTEKKKQIIRKICTDNIIVSYEDYQMMLKFLLEQDEK